MNQFGKILKFEFKGYLKNKIFVGVTVFLVLLIAVIMFFPRIADIFESENSDDKSKGLPIMLIKAESEAQAELTRNTFAQNFINYTVKITNDSIEEIKAKITSGEAECAFVMKGATAYTYYVNNLSLYDTNTAIANEALTQLYQINAMISSGMSLEEASALIGIRAYSTTENLGVDQSENFFYTYIMIFALYMVILLYGQMVATNVATEKSSRAMELLVTSAKPTSMMFGKVMASCMAGLIQLIAVFGSSLLFYNLNRSYWKNNQIVSSIFDMPPQLFVFMLIFFVLGFLVYAFMFGAVGSTASKLEDINTSVMPITMLFIIGFLVVITSMASGDVENTVMTVCSYIPFTSPTAMFTRIAMSTVAWYEIAISIAILAASVVGVGVLSAKIYRVGVLMYGTPPKISTLLKSIWRN